MGIDIISMLHPFIYGYIMLLVLDQTMREALDCIFLLLSDSFFSRENENPIFIFSLLCIVIYSALISSP